MGESQDKLKISELCGAIIGDGWIQSNERSFFIAGDPNEDKDYYDSYLSKIITKIITPVKPRNFLYWKVYGIGIYNQKSIKKLLSFGLPKGKKVKTAEVPNWILKSNNKVKISFVRGFFDADGSVFCQKDYTKYANNFSKKYHCKIRIRMSSTSKKLIDQVFELCKKNKINCVKRTKKRGFEYNRNNSDVYFIEINELKSIRKWFEELKPSNPKHTTKYRIWTKFGFCPPYTTINQRKQILKNKLNPYKFYKQE